MSEHATIQTEHFRPKLAGFWIRFWAYSIDLLVVYAISGHLYQTSIQSF